MEYIPNPSPKITGPYTVCLGSLDRVQHFVNGDDNSDFFWEASGYETRVLLDSIVEVDWRGLEAGTTTILKVTEINEAGCRETDQVTINVVGLAGKIENVSTLVDDANQLQITYSGEGEFEDGMPLYRKSPFFPNWEFVANLNQSNNKYIDISADPNQESYSYKFTYDDQCKADNESDVSTSILLEGVNDNTQSSLRWNDYVKWDSGVAYYQIWRNLDDQGWTAYGTAAVGDERIIYENGKDGLEMCYRIEAIENSANQPLSSWSNEVCIEFDHPLEVYNAFSPNGDGSNEYFYVENLEFYQVESITIFNRYGNTVYEASDYDNLWNGDDLPDGTYMYVLKVESIDEPFKGTVLIHR